MADHNRTEAQISADSLPEHPLKLSKTWEIDEDAATSFYEERDYRRAREHIYKALVDAGFDNELRSRYPPVTRYKFEDGPDISVELGRNTVTAHLEPVSDRRYNSVINDVASILDTFETARSDDGDPVYTFVGAEIIVPEQYASDQ